MAKDNYLVEVEGELLTDDTKDAYHFYDGREKVWLPKSQCTWDQDNKTMEMPGWLAIEKGLI
jgi:hypothetical protein